MPSARQEKIQRNDGKGHQEDARGAALPLLRASITQDVV
jgi:hypothetical protein